MRLRLLMIALLLAAPVVVSGQVNSPALPQHEVWQHQLDRVQSAVRSNDLATARSAMELLLQQALRFGPNDKRFAISTAALDSVDTALSSESATDRIAWFESLNALVEREGAITSPLATHIAIDTADSLALLGRWVEARDLLVRRAGRIEAVEAAGSESALELRTKEADIAVRQEDFVGAVTILEPLAETARVAFGAQSSRHIEVLSLLGRARVGNGDVVGGMANQRQAIELARKSVDGEPGLADRLSSEFAASLIQHGQWEEALAEVRPRRTAAELSGPSSRLANLLLQEARAALGTGNVGDAETATRRASSMLSSAGAESWSERLEADVLFAEIRAASGDNDGLGRYAKQALNRILDNRRLGVSSDILLRTARVLMASGETKLATQLAQQVLKSNQDPISMAEAAALLVSAGASGPQLPPEAGRVEEAARRFGGQQGAISMTGREVLTALAVARRAEGKGDEAVVLHQQATAGIDPGKVSAYELDLYDQYERTLRQFGNVQAAFEMRAQLKQRRATFASQLADGHSPTAVPAVERSSDARPAADGVKYYDGSALGFTVDLSGTPWVVAGGLTTVRGPEGDFTAANVQNPSLLMVHALPFVSDLDREAGRSVIEDVLLRDIPGERVPWRQGEFEGFTVKVGNPKTPDRGSLVRILSGPDGAYAVVVGLPFGHPNAAAEARRAIELVRFSKPTLTSLSSLDAGHRKSQGEIRYAIGRWFADRQSYQKAAQAFAVAAELQPDDGAIIESLVLSEAQLGRFGRVTELLDRSLDKFDNKVTLLAFRGMAYSRQGDRVSALRDFDLARQGGLRDERFLEQYVTELLAAGKTVEAARIIDDWKPTASHKEQHTLLTARVYAGNGNAKAARKLLEALRGEALRNPGTALAAMQVYRDLGDDARATEFAAQALAAGARSRDLYLAKAQAHAEAGQFDLAKATLEDALKFAPGDAATQSFLATVNDVIGKGNSSAIRDVVEPVPLPAEVLLTSPDTALRGAVDVGGYYLYVIEGIEFRPGKVQRRTTRLKAKVLDRAGIERLKTLVFDFHPSYERVFVNELLVRDGDGNIVSRGKVDDYFVRDSAEHENATSRKMLFLPVRGLQPGFTLELTLSRQVIDAPDTLEFFNQPLSRDLPIASSVVFVTGDVAAVAASSAGDGIVERSAAGSLVWEARDVAAMRIEPFFTLNVDNLPRVRLGSRGGDWRAIAATYLTDLKDYLADEPELKATAAQAAAGGASESAKAQAIARFVQDRLTYRAIEFGRRARIPNRPRQVLADGYGDCKDHAVLLRELLVLNGIKAHLALVSFTRSIAPSIASLDQFDHMVTYCETCGRNGTAAFLDATNKDQLQGTDLPFGLAGIEALVLDPAAPRLIRLGGYAASGHSLNVERRVEVSTDGGATVQEDVTLAGMPAARMRNWLREMDRSTWLDAVQNSLFSRTPSARLRHFDVTTLDADQPMIMKVQYDLPALFAGPTNRLVGRLPAVWERWLIGVPPLDRRTMPFEIEIPLTVESHVSVHPAAGHQVDNDTTLSGAGETRYQKWQSTAQVSAGDLSQQYELTRATGRYAPSDYQDFLDQSEKALRQIESLITIVPVH